MTRGTIRGFVAQAPELNAWSPTFRDPLLEARYDDDYFKSNVQYIRAATLLAAVAWAAFEPSPGWSSGTGSSGNA